MSEGGNNQFKKGIKWGQYLNTAGIKVFSRALFKSRALFVPHLTVKTIANVNFQTLYTIGGIRYLVFDKDNTLTLPYEREVHPSISENF